MKTLKLNVLEKSEMNATRGGKPVCDGACYVCTGNVQRIADRGKAYNDQARSYNWQIGFAWNGNVQPPKKV